MFHHLMGDPIINSGMMADEVMSTANIFRSERSAPPDVCYWPAIVMLSRGFDRKTPFNESEVRN